MKTQSVIRLSWVCMLACLLLSVVCFFRHNPSLTMIYAFGCLGWVLSILIWNKVKEQEENKP